MNPISFLMRVTGLSKVLVTGGLIAALILALGLAKCAYDRSIISNHDAKVEAAAARADQRADTRAADQRRADDARLTTEAQELGRATENAPSDEARRLARHRCLRLQQAARRDGKLSPACD